MPVWQNINLKQKAIFEIIQKPHARDLPYYLTDDELDFFVKGIAWGPHRETYLPRLVERHKRPIYIARGYAPPTYSRLVMLRYYGPDPLLEGHTGWDAGEEGEIMQYVLGWRWLYADWPGPLVDEVEDILPGTVFCPFDVCFFSHARTRLNCRSPQIRKPGRRAGGQKLRHPNGPGRVFASVCHPITSQRTGHPQ